MKGAWTTFLGALCLVFSSSQAFRVFFKMFVGIILIAVTHGLLLTPAILMECKCIVNGCGKKKDNSLSYESYHDETSQDDKNGETKQSVYNTFEITDTNDV
eukprot:452212_1